MDRVRAAVAIFAFLQNFGPALSYTTGLVNQAPFTMNPKVNPLLIISGVIVAMMWVSVILSFVAYRSTRAARVLCVPLLLLVPIRFAANVMLRLSVTPWSFLSLKTYTWLTLYLLASLPQLVLVVGAYLAIKYVSEPARLAVSDPLAVMSPTDTAIPRPVLPLDAPIPAGSDARAPVLAYAGAQRDAKFVLVPIYIALGYSAATCLSSLSSVANAFAPVMVGVFSRGIVFYLASLVAYGLAVGLSIAALRVQRRRFRVLSDAWATHAPGPASLAAALLLAGLITSLLSLAQIISFSPSWQVMLAPLMGLISAFAAPALVYLLGRASA